MRSHINTQIRLMAIAIIFVLITGLSSIYLLDAIQRAEDTATQEHQKLLIAAFELEEAHTQFKIQIQEWKNLLLRGKNADDFQHYFATFNHQTDDVQQRLAKVKFAFNDENRRQFEELTNEHMKLIGNYLKALSETKFSSPDSVQALDNSVRGMDRHLDTAFPELTQYLTRAVKDKLREDNQLRALAHRKHVLWLISCMSISTILIAFSSLWRLFKTRTKP